MNDAIQDSNKIKRGKASISPLMNENTKDIILLVQDISNVYDITSDENSILNKIKEEINELENYINSTHNHLNKAIEGKLYIFFEKTIFKYFLRNKINRKKLFG